jgi:hypothetical protein
MSEDPKIAANRHARQMLMIDKDGNMTPVPKTFREEVALVMMKEVYHDRASYETLIEEAPAEHFAKRAVELADALMKALEGKS